MSSARRPSIASAAPSDGRPTVERPLPPAYRLLLAIFGVFSAAGAVLIGAALLHTPPRRVLPAMVADEAPPEPSPEPAVVTPRTPSPVRAVVARPAACVPKTCVDVGAQCGEAWDGCGKKLDCGDCADGLECTGRPAQCVFKCVPLKCEELFAQCGDVDDGCGHTIQCGRCGAGETCGGAGVANACGRGTCRPFTCAERGLSHGRFSDGCDHVLDC